MGAQERPRRDNDDPLVERAATVGSRVLMGPGEPAVSEWAAAGLTLPDLDAMQHYRLSRIRERLASEDVAGALLFDPLNLMYATNSPNMQIWFTHNLDRWVFVATDGPMVLFDYPACEFLSAHNPLIDEVRPTTCFTYFIAGTRVDEQASAFAAEIADLVREHGGGNTRLAVDMIPPAGSNALIDAGLTLTDGMAVMERARAVKGPDEIAAMRCSVEATRVACGKMFEAMRPGMTEQQVWAVLWAEMLARGGEWMECRLLVSGPRTNPWFQECSSRVILNGDLVAFDTDLVGSYGMMTDISRTWMCGDAAPTPQQRHVHDLAVEQVTRNIDLLTPGRSFRELTMTSWTPPVDEYRHYSCLSHGVGQCDEWPDIKFPEAWEAGGYDGVLEPGMVMTVESYVGAYAGGEGVKLENQVLITQDGPENLSPWSLDLDSFHVL